jgi:3-dehydroquinate dehydratase II
MKIVIINGPNLNLLGVREKSIYGQISFDEYFLNIKSQFSNHELQYFQTNIEGEIINYLQKFGFDGCKIILNAGGYTHTSVAIKDAISAIESEVIEVHISNIYAREEFRQKSLIAPACRASICGFGLQSYELAIRGLIAGSDS